MGNVSRSIKLVRTRGLIWSAIALTACAPDGAGTDRGHADDRRAIEELHERDERAAVAGDTAALAALWSEDIVALPPGQPPVRGADEMREELRARLRSGPRWETLEYELDFEEVVIVDDIAYEWGSYRGRSRDPMTGDTVQGSGKLMRILKRTPEGTWKVHRTIWND